jgi:hypothetical protein
LKTSSMAGTLGNQMVACQGGVLAGAFCCASVFSISQRRLVSTARVE